VRLIPAAVFAEHRATATSAPLQASRGAAVVIIAIWIGLALVAVGWAVRYFAPPT
jgi:hypothetical protein